MTDEETKAQRHQVTCPSSHSHGCPGDVRVAGGGGILTFRSALGPLDKDPIWVPSSRCGVLPNSAAASPALCPGGSPRGGGMGALQLLEPPKGARCLSSAPPLPSLVLPGVGAPSSRQGPPPPVPGTCVRVCTLRNEVSKAFRPSEMYLTMVTWALGRQMTSFMHSAFGRPACTVDVLPGNPGCSFTAQGSPHLPRGLAPRCSLAGLRVATRTVEPPRCHVHWAAGSSSLRLPPCLPLGVESKRSP